LISKAAAFIGACEDPRRFFLLISKAAAFIGACEDPRRFFLLGLLFDSKFFNFYDKAN